MKLIEELKFGECFELDNNNFVITNNFRIRKPNNQHQVVNLKNGNLKWLDGNTIVNSIGLYTTDQDNNLVSVKEYKNDYQKYT